MKRGIKLTEQKVIEFKQNAVKNSTKEANKILNKGNGLKFEEMQERDDILTYKLLMEEDLRRLKKK